MISKFTVPTDSVVSGSINATNGLFVSASSTGVRNSVGGDGSNKFGYLQTNTHIFTGSVNITGSLSASSTISASAFYGDGSKLKNVNGNSAAFVDGNGTQNIITKWLDSNTITTSSISDDGTSIVYGNSNLNTNHLIYGSNTLYSDFAVTLLTSSYNRLSALDTSRTYVVGSLPFEYVPYYLSSSNTYVTGSNWFIMGKDDFNLGRMATISVVSGTSYGHAGVMGINNSVLRISGTYISVMSYIDDLCSIYKG